MDDFPHLVGGTVTEDNVEALRGMIDKVKENVLEKEEGEREEGKDKRGGYQEDLNEILSTVKTDATNTIQSLSKGFASLSANFRNQTSPPGEPKEPKETGEPTETSSSNPFSFSLFSDPQKLESTAAKLTTGLSAFFKNSIAIEPPEEIVEREKKAMFDRKLAKILQLQNTASTYIDHPEDIEGGSQEDFQQFISTLYEETLPQQSFQLLGENPEMKKIFHRLVPNVLPQTTFWHRYYYRVHLLEKEEEVKKKRVQDALGNEEELFSWDDGDSDEEPDKPKKDDDTHQPLVKLVASPTPSQSETPPTEPKSDETYEVVEETGPSSSSDKATTATPHQEPATTEQPSDKEDEDWGQWE